MFSDVQKLRDPVGDGGGATTPFAITHPPIKILVYSQLLYLVVFQMTDDADE